MFVFLGRVVGIEGGKTWPCAPPLPNCRLAATTAALRAHRAHAASDETWMLPPESAKETS